MVVKPEVVRVSCWLWLVASQVDQPLKRVNIVLIDVSLDTPLRLLRA